MLAVGHHLATSQLRKSMEGRTMTFTEKWSQRPDCPLSGAYITRLPLIETHQALSCLSHCGRGVVLIFVTQSTPISTNANGAAISTEEWDLLLYLSAFCHKEPNAGGGAGGRDRAPTCDPEGCLMRGYEPPSVALGRVRLRTHRLCGGIRVSRTCRMPTYG